MSAVRQVFAAALVVSACSSNDPAPTVTESPSAKRYPATGTTREFALTIDENVPWEVGPGAVYNASAYNRQIPGPTIDVTAGDHIVISLTNNGTKPHSIHTHVVEFTNANDGVDAPSLVMPGETKLIEWDAVFAGTFPYHDHGSEGEITLGLFGAVVVHAPDEKPAREHLVVLSDFDQADYQQLPGVADPETGEFPDAGTYRGGHQYMHTINGKAYEDAVPVFEGKVGDRSRWRIVSIGTEFHTWHIHGHRWLDANGVLTDNIALGPGMYTTFEYEEENPGSWLVHCHVPEHMEGGMVGRYDVTP